MKEVSFVILNYKSAQYLDSCISSIEKNISLDYEIIVVNNDSLDLNLEKKNLQIINTHLNLGFSKGCNTGAKAASGKILFFLNPDTELLGNNLTDYLDLLEKENIGILAPQLVLPSGEIQPWSSGRRITPLNILINNIFCKKNIIKEKKSSLTSVSWVSGAAMLINKDFFMNINGFDEKFFMYFEDVDLCLRVKKLKKKILLLPSPEIIHYGGKSSSNKSKQKEFYYASQDYYIKKNFGSIQAFIIKTIRELFIVLKNIHF